jgi:hypothetical protein
MGMPPFWALGYILPQFRGFQTIIEGSDPGIRENLNWERRPLETLQGEEEDNVGLDIDACFQTGIINGGEKAHH